MSTEPADLAMIKPEEGVRKPAHIDDSVLIGISTLAERIAAGETSTISLADVINTFSSILREIIAGTDDPASYLQKPETSLNKIAEDLAELGSAIWVCRVPVTKGTPLAASSNDGKVVPLTSQLDTTYTCVGFAMEDQTVADGDVKAARSGFILDGFTGLVTGAPYYIQVDGSLGIAHPVQNSGRVQCLGIGYADNKLFINIGQSLSQENTFI